MGAGATLWRMQNVRVGVIGVGGMGSFHAHTLASLAHVDVIAVADPYQPNVDKVTAALGCQGLNDPMALATDASLAADLVDAANAVRHDRDCCRHKWEWDGREWMQIANTGPSVRLQAAMVFDRLRQRLLRFPQKRQQDYARKYR